MQTAPRYPLVMHRGQYPNIESKHVHSPEQEIAAVECGFSTERRHIPEPEPEKPALALEERVSALEDRLAEIEAKGAEVPPEAKRGPGRPKKGE